MEYFEVQILIVYLYTISFFFLLFAACMVGSMNHSRAVILHFYRFLMHVQFCLISIPHVFFVLYGSFICFVYIYFLDDKSEDDSKQDQLSLDVKKIESIDSSHKEKQSNIG